MRIRTIMLTVAAVGLAGMVGLTPASADDAAEAPKDPTRGQWDSFLDPVRDVEDSVTGMQKDFEDYSKIHVGVGLDSFWEWNFNEPGHGSFNSLRSLDPDHAQAFMNLAQLRLTRPGEGWFIPGFGITLDGGRIARFIKSDWNGDGTIDRGDTFEKNSFDAQEAYLTWTPPDEAPSYLKGLSVKGGKFVTLLGAEVIEPWANYNTTRSFMFGFAIPFTHTGVLVSYPVTDKISVTGGVINGWDKVASFNNGWTGLANVTWTATDQVTLAGNVIWGPEQRQLGRKRAIGDFVATVKPTDALTLLLNYDYAQEDNASLTGGTALWQGFAAVANYAFTDRASAAVRGEWFEDHGGSRTGTKQQLWEGTLTGRYNITQHLFTRAEFRHDESDKRVFAAGDTKILHGQDTIGFEFGYVWN